MPVESQGHNRQIAEMLDSFGEGFIAFDFDWRVTHCNREAAAHYGLRPADLVGQLAWAVPGLSDDGALKEFLERALASGTAIEAEAQSEIRSGRWFYLRAFPLEGGLGLSSRDITERRDVARREHEQAERLDLALATAGFGDWSWDIATDTIDFSPRAAEIIGAPAPGPVGTWSGLLAYMDEGDRERSRLALDKALAEHGTYELEYRFHHPRADSERWIMVRARGRYADDGTPSGLLGVLTDITEAKAEAARIQADRARLAESEARFRALADSAPAPVWVLDASGGLEFVNHAFRDMVGRPVESLAGDGWLDLLHPEDRLGVDAARAGARRGARPNTWEARFRVASGEYRWLRTTSRARFDEAGAFQGYVGLATDVTDERRAEERQRLLINELNHRVKNTLATIQSLARQTLRDGVTAREARERLTERLLALSAAHNVLTRENWEGADLRDIAREAVRPYDDQGDRIIVTGPNVRLAPNVALALSMALHELATNALKYGALSVPQGCVTLDWSLDGQAIDLVWREAGGPAVQPPQSSGFGSRLLAGLAGELGAPAEVTYAPQGVVCRLRAPTL